MSKSDAGVVRMRPDGLPHSAAFSHVVPPGMTTYVVEGVDALAVLPPSR